MPKTQNSKKYDLEDRTFKFARDCRILVKKINNSNLVNQVDGKQLIRSSGSVAANWIEANESLSKKDFVHRVKICRKEAKESRLWLRLLDIYAAELDAVRHMLIKESIELQKIFGSIIEKSK